MKKNKISKYLIFISVFTFISIFTLIVQNSYSKLIGPIQKIQTSNLMKPVDPSFDLSTLNSLEKRQEFIQENEPIFSVISSQSSSSSNQ